MNITIEKKISNKITNEEVKSLELRILIKVAEYCERNGLRYFLAYGTLIGAIRHEGFIPWDNDIDIFMPRPDYERLILLVKEQPISDRLTLLHYCDVRTFPFVKIVDNRTLLKEHFLRTEDNCGVYIDIFPLDGLPDEACVQKRIFKKAKLYYTLYALANYRFNTGSTFLKKFIKNIFYPFSKLISNYKVCEKLNQLCQDYNYDKATYVGNIVWGEGEREIMPRIWYTEVNGKFENNFFYIPSGYDYILKKIYGEYMKIPPIDQQIVHEFEAEWKT